MISEDVIVASVVDAVVATSVRSAAGCVGCVDGVVVVVLYRAPRIQKIALRAIREDGCIFMMDWWCLTMANLLIRPSRNHKNLEKLQFLLGLAPSVR